MRLPFSLLAAMLMLAVGFTGCLGGDDAPAEPVSTPQDAAATPVNESLVDDGSREGDMSLGEQDHIHDYWMGAERMTIMDDDVTSDQFRTLAFTFFNTFQGSPGVGGGFLELPEGAIVFEGAGELEFTATWNDPLVTGMTMRYRAANSNDFTDGGSVASATPIAIKLTADMTDMPHAKSSRWGFFMTPGAGQSMAGTYHVKIDIIKTRDPTMFPGHPDHFNGENTLTLFDGQGRSAQTSGLSDIIGAVSQNQNDDSIVAEKVVPMRAGSMTANMTVTSAQSSVGGVAEVWLEYRPADSFRYFRAQLLSADVENGVYQFGLPVTMEQTDSPYAKQSAWHFRIRATSDPTGQGDSSIRGVSDIQIDYDMQIVVYDTLLDGISEETQQTRGNR